MKHRFRNSVKDVQTLPGADIDSDHDCKFRFCHEFYVVGFIKVQYERIGLKPLAYFLNYYINPYPANVENMVSY